MCELERVQRDREGGRGEWGRDLKWNGNRVEEGEGDYDASIKWVCGCKR